MSKLFFCYDHQHKADSYIGALKRAGWEETRDPGKGRFVLTDVDIMPRARSLREYHKRGIRVFCYPHAARPNLFWDFPGHSFTDFITACFVPAPGHEAILRAYGTPYPIEAVGWHLSELRDFAPREKVRKILFAPIHPNNNGFLSSLDKKINADALRLLVSLTSDPEISLTVRYLKDLKDNGLWKAGGVDYIPANPDGSTQEIDRADLVVSHQTFAFLSVARGVPTLMMGEWMTPRWGGSEAKLTFARSWELYKHLLMYPLDLLDPTSTEPVECLIERAAMGDPKVSEWRSRLIGEAFDPELFVSRVESYL
jgi:hypothetical protein